MLLNAFEFKLITALKCCSKMWTRTCSLKGCLRWRNTFSWLQNLKTLLEDDKTRTRDWNAARWWRNANSWFQDLKTLLERTRNAVRRRRYANSCSQDLEALLEDLVVAEWHLPDSTLRTYWNITRGHRARLVWSNRDSFAYYNLLTYLHLYIFEIPYMGGW